MDLLTNKDPILSNGWGNHIRLPKPWSVAEKTEALTWMHGVLTPLWRLTMDIRDDFTEAINND